MEEEWRYYEGVVEMKFKTVGVWSPDSDKACEKILDKITQYLELKKFVSYADEDKDKKTIIVHWDYEK